ncbi:MAG: fructose-bisphosphate aldolase class I [Candidatus Pacebacteria bacterium]|nr:fructose-bisphosphate aldolase class I [Candidatus Paceibacterota bacterium]MCF7857202.1 fructose-bisphosphate aldolase class I [Candidatus Paceibacterota bacterium]
MQNNTELYKTVSQLMLDGKGILAADESDGTAGKRLALANLPNQSGNRQDFREMLFTAPGIEEFLSGIILYDSTIRESTDQGVPFVDVLIARGMVPGIKVDGGVRQLDQFEGEVVTQGLDGLDERFKEYYKIGARFAKWRAVVNIGEGIPTNECLELNAVHMVEYALIAQANGIVPIVEPEVMFPGSHTLEEAEEVTTRTLNILFSTLKKYRVDLKGLILKSSMVLAGDTNPQQSTADEVASATLRTFKLSVPRDVGGIVFLSGGQAAKRATENLQAIASFGKQPWPITFSYSRAIQEPFLLAWQGKSENVSLAQKALLYRVKMNALAQLGKYDASRDTK